MGVPAKVIPVQTDLSTHEGMATELVNLLTQANLQIPIVKARDMVEILDWLEAIKTGELSMAEATKQ